MQDKKIAIITSVIPKVNLAFQQNALPLITEIELRNSGTNKPPVKFSLAKQEAEHKLANDDDFVLAINIKRARAARITPLSEKDLLSEQHRDVEAFEKVVTF